MGVRKRLFSKEAILLRLDVKPNEDGRKTARYSISEDEWAIIEEYRLEGVDTESKPFVISAWSSDGRMMGIDEYCEHYNLNRDDIEKYNLVSHTGAPYYNIRWKTTVAVKEVLDYDFIDEIVAKHIHPVLLNLPYDRKDRYEYYVDRVILTDVHIGMTPNKSGHSLYGGKWDEEELMKRADELIKVAFEKGKGNTIIIDDLGDLLDGWDGETVRKGHKLPQNMTNSEMFDVAVRFKMKLIDAFVQEWNVVIMNNICEDNHAGEFGYVVNSAVKSIAEQKYGNVTIVNHRKFINHYYIGEHCIVLSHGKDSHALKFGFKPHLDPKQIEKIDQYIKQNDIYKTAKHIEFSKGDSHQLLLDYCTSDDFDYCNYHAFSPSSEWVQTNFKKGRSGFTLQIIKMDDVNKEVHHIFF